MDCKCEREISLREVVAEETGTQVNRGPGREVVAVVELRMIEIKRGNTWRGNCDEGASEDVSF